jgi:hypothetical protein
MSKLLKVLTVLIFSSWMDIIFANEINTNPREEVFTATVPTNTNHGHFNDNNRDTFNSSNGFSENSTASSHIFTEASLNSSSSGREPIGLIFDHTFSAVVGAEAIITAEEGYMLLDNRLAPTTAGQSSGSMMAGRFGKMLFESLLSTTAMVTQHEIFGHGARAREFHLHVNKYTISPFSGSTSFSGEGFRRLSRSEQMAVIAGGIEGTSILARQLRDRWFRTQTIDSREANLYFFNYMDQTQYVLRTKNLIHDNTFKGAHGNDILMYVDTLNLWNPTHLLTTSQLRRKVLADLFNPYLYYSIYSLGLYVIDGCQSWEYPMITLGEYQYLPMFRLLLAPYGPEYQMTNLIRGPEHNIIANFRFGNTGRQHSTAIGVEITDVLSSDKLFIDGKIEVWNQPKLFTQFASGREKIGAAASLLARFPMLKQMSIIGQVGYKTTGYMPGEELKHAPILRIGFLLNL